MKRIEKILILIIHVLKIPLVFFTERHYLISGTYRNSEGERMFCRTFFRTFFFQFPLDEIEEKLAEELAADKRGVLITSIQRVPRWMVNALVKERGKSFHIETSK